MRRDRVFRVWTTVVAFASLGSGAVLWYAGERLAGSFGIATALVHLVWAANGFGRDRKLAANVLCTVHKIWRRRPIVIPTLRPIVVSPPRHTRLQRLRAWGRRRG
jgi:hypothetical protein